MNWCFYRDLFYKRQMFAKEQKYSYLPKVQPKLWRKNFSGTGSCTSYTSSTRLCNQLENLRQNKAGNIKLKNSLQQKFWRSIILPRTTRTTITRYFESLIHILLQQVGKKISLKSNARHVGSCLNLFGILKEKNKSNKASKNLTKLAKNLYFPRGVCDFQSSSNALRKFLWFSLNEHIVL